jgi:hypothetical protein
LVGGILLSFQKQFLEGQEGWALTFSCAISHALPVQADATISFVTA